MRAAATGRSSPRLRFADLRDLGFDLVSRANNHALDWGVEGMRETSRRLDDAGLVHAGVGENREQARAARYLETPLGRVGLVSIASTFRDYSDALPPHGAAPGRPGVNALHVSRTVLVAPETMRSLLALRDTLEAPAAACELSERAAARRRVRPAAPAELTLLDTRFRIGAPPGDRWEMRASDRDEILRVVRLYTEGFGAHRPEMFEEAFHSSARIYWTDADGGGCGLPQPAALVWNCVRLHRGARL